MHDHKPIYFETFEPDQEIAFHSKLRDWLKQYWNLSDKEVLHIQEVGCEDNSCPVYETVLIATEDILLDKQKAFQEAFSNSLLKNDNSQNSQPHTSRILKLGKAKHLLTKQDIYFSVEKQKSIT